MPATNQPGRTIRRQANAGAGIRGERIDRHVAAALAELRLAGAVTGARSQRISVRVDPGVMRAAAARLGILLLRLLGAGLNAGIAGLRRWFIFRCGHGWVAVRYSEVWQVLRHTG